VTEAGPRTAEPAVCAGKALLALALPHSWRLRVRWPNGHVAAHTDLGNQKRKDRAGRSRRGQSLRAPSSRRCHGTHRGAAVPDPASLTL